MVDIKNKPLYYLSLHSAGEGPIHPELPCWYLAAHGFTIIRLSPVRGHSDLEDFYPVSFPQIVVPEARGAIWPKAWQHVAFTREVIRLRFRENGLYYIYGSMCTPDLTIALMGVEGRRVIYHTQDYLEPSRYPLRAKFEARIARKAGLVVCNEPNRARFMQSFYRMRATPLVVPTALPAAWPIAKPSEGTRREILAGSGDTNVKIILHQGPYSAVRMSPQLLEAIAQLPENYVVVFTGMGDSSPAFRECYEQARALGIERRVISKPYLTYRKLLEYTVNADVGVLLYPNDGIGNYYQCPGRLSECAACGLPFVTSNFPGLENLLYKYPIGRTCDPYSPREIAQALQALAEVSPRDAEIRRKEIQRIFKEHLAYEHGAKALIARVQEMVNDLSS